MYSNKKKNINVVILAAGKGTRMNNNLPKVMHKICDKTLIERVLSTARFLKAKKVLSVISPDMKEVENFIKENFDSEIVHQKERLGTGNAVKLTLNNLTINSDVIILYGDTPLVKPNTIKNLLEKTSNGNAICILGFKAKNPSGYGRIILDEADNVAKIIEHNDANENERRINICNSGVMVFGGKYIKEIINKIDNNNSKKEYYLTDSVAIAVNMGLTVKTIITDENEVMGINSQKERAQVEKIKQDELREAHLKNGVIIIAPQTVYFSEDTKIASGTIIEPNVIFKGKVDIKGKCEIRAFSYLEDCLIEEGVVVGPYARIRPDTKLKKNSRIGNFVEIKKSEIGKNSKINHLSYIGDTVMGNDVNIGAGTITCNYDGKKKFKTIIEDGAFIGSNSSLVAPVKIGKNSVVGAGTTLLKDVPAKKTVVNKKEIKILNKKD